MQLAQLSVALSIVVYCLSVSAVPIYNKLVFASGVGHGAAGLRKFPYPIATAFLQLLFVSLCLGLWNVLQHLLRRCCSSLSRRRAQRPWRPPFMKSWLFGPHLPYKLRHTAPVGVLFGLKYGVTNWGLQLVPIGIHLLLQATDLLWTAVAARCLNQERFGVLEVLACALSTVGSVFISLHAVQTLQTPVIGLLVNLLTPLFLALCISTLRLGTAELFRADNQLEGTMTPSEFTSLKLLWSSLMALALSMLLESGHLDLSEGLLNHIDKPPWWEALDEEPLEGVLLLLFGGVFVLIFQVNLTWLTGLTSALTVGVVGGLKVVPQWFLNALFHLSIDLKPLNVLGAALVLSSSALYAASITSEHRLLLCSGGFRWEPRSCEIDMNRWPASEPMLPSNSDAVTRRTSAQAWLEAQLGLPTPSGAVGERRDSSDAEQPEPRSCAG